MSEREEIHNYLKTLGRYLSRLDKADADEVIREIESAIFDAIDFKDQAGEEVDTGALLQGFGSPRELAESYVSHIKLGTPPPVGFSAIGKVKQGASKTLYYGMAIFGFSFAAGLILTGIANLIVPESVGIWSSAGGESIVIGLIDAPLPIEQEIAGFWYTPVALVLGYAITRLTISISRVLKRQMVQ